MKSVPGISLALSLLIHLTLFCALAMYGASAVAVGGSGDSVQVYLMKSGKKATGSAMEARAGESPVTVLPVLPAGKALRAKPSKGIKPEMESDRGVVTSAETHFATADIKKRTVERPEEYKAVKGAVPISRASYEPEAATGLRIEAAEAEKRGAGAETAPADLNPVKEYAGAFYAGYPGGSGDGVVSSGSVPGLKRPYYPRRSRERNEQGRVVLAVKLLPGGTPIEVRVLSSSGYKRLDRVALRAVKRSVFTARNALFSIKIAFNFRLEER